MINEQTAREELWPCNEYQRCSTAFQTFENAFKSRTLTDVTTYLETPVN